MTETEDNCSSDAKKSPEKAGMDNSKDDNKFSLPWEKCVMGCDINGDKEVYLLNCFHAICSEKCLNEVKSEVKPGSTPACKRCLFKITLDDSLLKITPHLEFLQKTVPSIPIPICDICIFDHPASSYCAECPASLCKRCNDLHPQTRTTHKHIVQPNLEEYYQKEKAKMEEDASKCDVHKMLLTDMCSTCCNQKICGKCIPDHNKHKTFVLKQGRDQITSSIELAKKCLENSSQAVAELEKKREKLCQNWEEVQSEITKQFTQMMELLVKRQDELRKEAKEKFQRKLSSLGAKAECMKLTNLSATEFLQTAEHMVAEMDCTSSVNLWRHSKIFTEWMFKVNKKISEDFDKFVDKDWNFLVGDSSVSVNSIKQNLATFSNIDYVHQSSTNTPAKAKSIPVSTSPLKIENQVNVQPNSKATKRIRTSGNASSSLKSPNVKKIRQFAVKSTTPCEVDQRGMKTERPEPQRESVKSPGNNSQPKKSIKNEKSPLNGTSPIRATTTKVKLCDVAKSVAPKSSKRRLTDDEIIDLVDSGEDEVFDGDDEGPKKDANGVKKQKVANGKEPEECSRGSGDSPANSNSQELTVRKSVRQRKSPKIFSSEG